MKTENRIKKIESVAPEPKREPERSLTEEVLDLLARFEAGEFKGRKSAGKPSRDVQEFLAVIDAIAERLKHASKPKREPEAEEESSEFGATIPRPLLILLNGKTR